jgi:hypothetical protein
VGDLGVLVPRESARYLEFARLYQLARSLRPTAIDRWNGDLYASHALRWGSFDPLTGDQRMSGELVLARLTGTTSASEPRAQAQALATVLHEATHAGMQTDARDQPNAVRTLHSRGAMEGFAEFRAISDFEVFTVSAGYPGLEPPEPQYPGAYAAMNSLVTQVSGPAKDRYAFLAEAARGPAVMHFDQLADGVVKNRLAELVPDREQDRRAVRAALIKTMLHPQWPILHESSAAAGELAAEDICRRLNAKVDEIRHHYHACPTQPFPADFPAPEAAHTTTPEVISGPTQDRSRRPDELAQGNGRGDDPLLVVPDGRLPPYAAQQDTPAAASGLTAPSNLDNGRSGEMRSVRSTSENPGTGQTSRASSPDGLDVMRFLTGQAPASEAVKQAPSPGDGSRGGPPGLGGSRFPTTRPRRTDRGRD